MNDKLTELEAKKKEIAEGGGEARVKAQHARGKLTARERIEKLLDPGSFTELSAFCSHRSTDFGLADTVHSGDAVVTGSGTIGGRKVFLYSQDFTVLGGSISEVVGQKVRQIVDMAIDQGAPLIAINDSGGARIQEGVASLCGVGDILLLNALASGSIPQISIIVGPSAGGAVYGPALTDFVFMVKGMGQMYITGPDVVKAVTGEEVTHEALGGADVHARKSGVSHFTFNSEVDCYEAVRRLLSFIPSSFKEAPPRVATKKTHGPQNDETLNTIVPDDPKKAYDMKKVITAVIDNGDFMEVHAAFAPNMIVGFARVDGQSVGIVAQQPNYLAGVIDINASVKAARFVRFCDAFNIPLVSFVDVPGFMPGVDQEHGGIIRHGAKLIFAYAEATVPKITVITRKAYGGAYIVMSSRHLRGDINLAWPCAEIAVMGAEGAVAVIHRKKIAESAEPEAERQRCVSKYREKFDNPYQAAALGYVDDVIVPAETRPRLIQALKVLAGKRGRNPAKKHGNIPL
ncbi:acyl-CoA carboxylase subunit beta [Dehalogenimonas etheniformans]|uniref:Acyl-CoA carboxylase subunit beta n=1 Tax=Dehalogenimonas etheniformans TaxID=1536648 RepID=A0A2P5P8M4_9CHLR|nr:acyl-CoA carboxylase subunit beta [Dehalogenimonas etheniformans]PPD58641.1 acyl-CoA carboxylase subunit beta [Dehalogenimonas etheniformans]QNT76589.1 acyl-CoA carboxylase subunit beta [Dehalogenimonas etheniformans]